MPGSCAVRSRSASPRRRPGPRSTRSTADCALYMARALDLDDVVALLESGTNVVTTRGEFFAGGQRLADERSAARHRRVHERAARRSTRPAAARGSSPTRFRSRCCRCSAASSRWRSRSSPILSRRDSPHLLFEQMKFGQPVSAFDDRRSSYLLGEFGPPLGAARRGRGPTGRRVGVQRRGRRRPRNDDDRRRRAAGRIGRRAAHDDRRHQRRATTSCASRANWYCTTDVEPAWDLRPTGWRVRVRGDAPLRRRPPVPDPARRPRFVHAGVHREPTGERDPLRVRAPPGSS